MGECWPDSAYLEKSWDLKLHGVTIDHNNDSNVLKFEYMSKMIDSEVWRRCPCFLFLSRRTHWHLPWFGHLLPRIFESAEVAMASTCTWADWRWKGSQQKQQRSYFLPWEKNLWPWETLLLPPHNWGETSIFSDQFGLLNCKDDVCITSKNATTIQCYHLHLPTCSMTSDNWQFFGWHCCISPWLQRN